MYLVRMLLQMAVTAVFTASFFLAPLAGLIYRTPLPEVRVTMQETSEERVVHWSPPAPKGDPDAVAEVGAAEGEPVVEKVATKVEEVPELGVERPGASAVGVVAAVRRGAADGVGSHYMVRPRSAVPAPRDRSTTGRGPRCEPSTDGIARVDDATFLVERELVDEYSKLQKAQELVGWVARHETETGDVDGVVIGGIRCGSPLHLAGLRNGDIVHDINGMRIQSIPGALRAYAKLRKASILEVNLTRRGKGMRVTYEIG